MSDWRPSFIAATIVLCGGGLVGASTAPDRSETKAATASQGGQSPGAGRGAEGSEGKDRSRGQATSPGTETTSTGLEVAPPADTRAPDTLTELYEGGQIDENVFADFGAKTIANKTYEGVSMDDRSDDGIQIETKGLYKRLRGVVGISAGTPCPRIGASVSITDDRGQNLWGPYDVGFNSPKRFDFSIKGLIRVNLVQSGAPSGDGCGTAESAWGDVEFVK